MKVISRESLTIGLIWMVVVVVGGGDGGRGGYEQIFGWWGYSSISQVGKTLLLELIWKVSIYLYSFETSGSDCTPLEVLLKMC